MDALDSLGYGNPPLGIWLDVESKEVIGQDPGDVTAVCSSFISKCNAAGYSAGIYANLSTLVNNINVGDLAEYVPYWCAEYSDSCDFKDYFPNNTLDGWQYTDKYMIDENQYDMSEWY